ncbi:MAG TPA: GNAT family protein, partial [Thermomicrobiales bacterium]|nr:GNAT family protein [Thermomicrobiales bacterium]
GGGDPPMPQQLERLVADFERDTAGGGRDDGRYAIEIDGRFAGSCGLFDFDWTNRTAQLGIGIGEQRRWGQGYGREAIGLLLDVAFRLRNLRRVWLRTHAGNERALRCYRACGFQEEGRLRQHVWTDGGYQDEVYLGLLRSEWLAAQPDRGDSAAVDDR